MARHVQEADCPIIVSDLRVELTQPFVERGGRAAASPAEVARESDVIFTSVPAQRKWKR